MPFPNEHACRLKEPVKDAKTRRQNGAQKHNGKAYDVIFQEQDGKWVEQAYRYPKDKWSASEAKSHCAGHDGSFEAASESKSLDDPDLEIRFLGELRVEGDHKPMITGYAAVFNSKSEDLGGFREYVKPGAFTKTLKESDVRALVNHDPNYVLGRTKNGTLKMKEDNLGLHFEVEPPNTGWARDLMTQIKRGDIDQASFGFKTIKDDWRQEDGENVRDLQECRLYDVSVVTQPAYSQTSVACRSRVEALKTKEPGDTSHSIGEPVKDHSEKLRRLQKLENEQRLLEVQWLKK